MRNKKYNNGIDNINLKNLLQSSIRNKHNKHKDTTRADGMESIPRVFVVKIVMGSLTKERNIRVSIKFRSENCEEYDISLKKTNKTHNTIITFKTC